MKTRRWIATCVVALLGVTAVLAKDIRVVVFKVAQMHCEKCEKKVKDNMRFEKGLKDLSTEVKTKTVTITYDADKTNVKGPVRRQKSVRAAAWTRPSSCARARR